MEEKIGGAMGPPATFDGREPSELAAPPSPFRMTNPAPSGTPAAALRNLYRESPSWKTPRG